MTALSVVMGIDVSGGDAPPPSAPRQQAWGEESTPPPPRRAPSPKPAPKEDPMEVSLSDEEKEALKLKELGNAAYKAKKFEEALEVGFLTIFDDLCQSLTIFFNL